MAKQCRNCRMLDSDYECGLCGKDMDRAVKLLNERGIILNEIIYITDNDYLGGRFIKRFSEDLKLARINLVKIDRKKLQIILDDFIISAIPVNRTSQIGCVYRNVKYFINSVFYSFCYDENTKEMLFYKLRGLIERFPKEAKEITCNELIDILKE